MITIFSIIGRHIQCHTLQTLLHLWKQLYKERSAVERVNAYLKEYFQLDNVRHRSGKKAKLHFQMVMFSYNACKLAADRVNAQLQNQQSAA